MTACYSTTSLGSNSRSLLSRSAPAVEQSMSSVAPVALPRPCSRPRPPPPPRPPARPPHVATGGPASRSPRPRDHVPQPRLLTTSLGSPLHQGAVPVSAGLTPATTLSSPFSQATGSPYTPHAPSPASTSNGTSPMASRRSSVYTNAYNPQEWVPVAGSPQVAAAAPFPHVQQHGEQILQPQVFNG